MDTFEIIRGDSASFEIEVVNDENVAVDLTGQTISFTAKKNPDDPDSQAVLSKQVSNGGVDGKVVIDFTSTETSGLKPRSYWWDIQLVKNGVVNSTIRQLFKVVGDITRENNEDIS